MLSEEIKTEKKKKKGDSVRDTVFTPAPNFESTQVYFPAPT